MSDERKDADAADDGDDTTSSRAQTAVVTRPLRPTGKRTRQAPDTDGDDKTDDKAGSKPSLTKNGATKAKTAKKAGDSEGGRNPFAFVWNYLKQVVAELRKVIWPNRKQMVSYTIVVLVFLAFMVALISAVDLGLARLALQMLG